MRETSIRQSAGQDGARIEDGGSVSDHRDELVMHPANIRRALGREYIVLEKPPRRRFSGNK